MPNKFPKEAQFVELMERSPEHYNYAYNELKKMFPVAEKFVEPVRCLAKMGYKINYKNVFNMMLSAFKELLVQSSYIRFITNLSPEDILDDYFIQKDEPYDMVRFQTIFYFPNDFKEQQSGSVLFTRFANRTLQERKKDVIKHKIEKAQSMQ